MFLNYFKCVIFFVFAGIAFYGHANPSFETEEHELPVVNISKVIKDSHFACSPKQALLEVYFGGAYIRSGINPVFKLRNQTIQLESYQLSGVKKVSQTKRESNHWVEETLNLDIDVYMHGLHILRLSSYALEDVQDQTESAGFYYVIKGNPAIVSAKLNKMGVNLDNLEIEKTPANNTRVRCSMT